VTTATEENENRMTTAYPSRDAAWALLIEHVQGESLRKHCLAVETAMRAYAHELGEDEDAWGLVGLIHDFDFEMHPTLDLHPHAGIPILAERGYPDWVLRAIRSHADDPKVPRQTPLEKTLYAVDELTGFISAVALVRPSRAVVEVTPESVKKKMKDKRFAAGIHRDALTRGAEDLGIDFDDHVRFVVAAMAANAAVLGLAGVEAGR